MHKATSRNRHTHRNHFDFYGDLEKIREAFADVTRGVKGKAGEALTNSIDGMRERSELLQDSVSDYITDKPIKSVGVALLCGLMIGYLLHK